MFGGGLRDIRVANNTGTIVTVAGNGSQGYSGDNGLAINAELYFPFGVFVDSHGNIFVSDALNNRVRKIDSNTGIITTIAGNGTQGYSGDGGLAIDATLSNPQSLYVDSQGTLFITDMYNNVVRKVNAITGIITTIAGNGNGGYSGDGGPATDATLYFPEGIALDSIGNIYIVENGNFRVRKVDATTGIITTVIGNGTQGHSGDGGLAINAELNYPVGIAIDSSGNIYISDTANSRIRKVDSNTGTITTIAGNGQVGYSGDGGLAVDAQLYDPMNNT